MSEPAQSVPILPVLPISASNIPTNVPVAMIPVESIPRVATVPNLPLKVPAVLKTSRNLKSNKNHVFTDPHPVVHDALKIIRIKGSNATPLNPLRFRVRWKDSSPKYDTWEPLSHVHTCQPFLDFVQSKPKLWYLLEGRDELQSNTVLHIPKTAHEQPISSVHAQVLAAALEKALAVATIDTYGDAAYAKAIVPCPSFHEPTLDNVNPSLNKFEMYDLLQMNYTADMNNDMWVACAAGDMDGDGDELRSVSSDPTRIIGFKQISLNIINFFDNMRSCVPLNLKTYLFIRNLLLPTITSSVKRNSKKMASHIVSEAPLEETRKVATLVLRHLTRHL